MNTIGEIIKRAREQVGLNQGELAAQIRHLTGTTFTRSALNQIESGATKNPKPLNLQAACDVLGIDLRSALAGKLVQVVPNACLTSMDRLELAARLKEALQGPGMKTAVAEACDVTEQAVTGWVTTGRIHKKHFPVLERVTGYRLMWLLTGQEPKRVGPSPRDHDLDEIVDGSLVPPPKTTADREQKTIALDEVELLMETLRHLDAYELKYDIRFNRRQKAQAMLNVYSYLKSCTRKSVAQIERILADMGSENGE